MTLHQSMKLIGIGDNGQESLLPQYRQWITDCEVLVGGERVLDFFPSFAGEKIVIKGGLSSLVERLSQETRKTVILASGDPLFYGIGGYLAKKLTIEVYPYMSSVQLAFSKMGESWQDAYVTSIHGRPIKGLAQRIDGKKKVALLTDADNNPNVLGRYLKHFGMTEYRAFVAENLQGADEKYGWYSLDELEEAKFSPLNVVILQQTSAPKRYALGIDDEAFSQRKPDKGLITKKEIRVLSLQAMQLQKDSTIWDVGTCTGSMAIEAGKLAPEGQVFAVEKNAPDLENCLQNQQKFRVDITAIHSKAPAGLEQFPDPDAIFIGGTGGEMVELLQLCCTRLKANGRIVLNAATIENLYKAVEAFKACGFVVEILQAQLARSKPILDMTRFVPLNPIYIISAYRKEENHE
ncbi:precorrin-6y C5,15-methyltransferase (decarboxylating) subunit CbiE [Lysinibacillus tabacifolii]|uniref:Precorrin-6y C5,15-methyltransferase (Decarboxylating) subunit CbiE n=1 Tax=Lysinibacillus tabacifolii TaxID=1173107 RepID=A0ABY2T2Y7_9BACI|nr:precorrin-6y C5,15-methyltransferase (decarboxylating) subunit CbiE [Lysinibacillus tabacifolii]TKI50356.1 precorrin-6y C5,15-methyltransferase (decarboxylating) subunit CbiE [Lysinibacillus tabacifolii]